MLCLASSLHDAIHQKIYEICQQMCSYVTVGWRYLYENIPAEMKLGEEQGILLCVSFLSLLENIGYLCLKEQ
jgi:hypothetical protein